MSGEKRIPPLHAAVVQAAVKAVLGERVIILRIVEVPSRPSLKLQVDALSCGVRTFWSRWTGRHSNGENA